MNRIDRLFAILLQLQRRRRVRAQDLARLFEVSERTIYRDMYALGASGVPIVALPGAGYELVEGYYLPPLLFTPGEAGALSLSARMLIAHAGGRLGHDAEQALAKIAAVLPEPQRAEIEQLAATIQFFMPSVRFDLDDPRLAALQRAIQERRVVRLRYHSRSQGEQTVREVEPHSLTYSSGAWYLDGYCRLRAAMRGFRLDRIDDLAPLDERFEPHAPPRPAPAMIDVRVRFAPHVARWARERQHYAFVCEERAPGEDGVIMSYRVEALGELLPWLLGWGAGAEVLAPAELRAQIRAEAQRLAEILT